MRILVTGAGGFLGRHLVGILLAAGHDVVAVSSQNELTLREAWTNAGYATTESVSVIRTEDLIDTSSVFSSIDVLVNAGFPRVASGELLALGLDFQAHLFQKAKESGISRIVNISSQSVYGASRMRPALESDDTNLDNPYATAKYASEVLANVLLSGVSLVHVRLSSLIGVGFDQRLVNKMVRRALAGESITITGDPQEFDFMDVRDAAYAIELVCCVPLQQTPEVLNVGSSNPRSLQSIADIVTQVLRDDFSIEVAVTSSDTGTRTHSSALKCEKLTEGYEFKNKYSLRETIHSIALDLNQNSVHDDL